MVEVEVLETGLLSLWAQSAFPIIMRIRSAFVALYSLSSCKLKEKSRDLSHNGLNTPHFRIAGSLQSRTRQTPLFLVNRFS